jgi:ArsR family transcriptional regulator
MDDDTQKLYEMKADVLKALGHPLRLAVVDFLRDGEQCVCDIAEHVGAERSNVSRHLALMLKAGILDQRKEGLRMMYGLRCRCVLDFFACVEGVLREQLEENAALLKQL